MVRTERSDFEALTKTTHKNNRHSNTFAEPSHCINTNQQLSSYVVIPKLLNSEHRLLYDNEGCLKCHCVFINHHSNNCPNSFLDAMKYKTLMQYTVDVIRQHIKNLKPLVTALPLDDVSFDNNTLPLNPVATIMGTSSNPVTYMPSNASNMIEGESDSDNSVSNSVPTKYMPKALSLELTPLTVPHLFWQCSISGATNSFPLFLNVLIDHGAHTVLISDGLICQLSLKCHRLHNPMPVKLVMSDNGVK